MAARARGSTAVVLDRLDLVHLSSERLLLVVHLKSGAIRTIFVQIPASIAPATVEHVARILNERLAGLSLREIRATLTAAAARRETAAPAASCSTSSWPKGEEIFDLGPEPDGLVLGSAELLADQPEFASNARMRGLLSLTGGATCCARRCSAREQAGLSITIGSEHDDPRLADFTLVTSSYRLGDLSGVIGVIGPTRMPYDKIIGLVQHTSRLVEGLIT